MGKDASVILLMRIAGTVLWMAYTVILARSLSQEDFAIALYVMNLSFFAVLVVTMGRDVSILKFASRNWSMGNLRSIRSVLVRTRIALMWSSAVLILALLTAWLLGFDSPITQDWHLALLTGLLAAAGAQMAINRDCLRAVGMVWQSQLGLNLTRSVVPIIGSVIAFATNGLTVVGALVLFLASLLLSVLVEEYFLRGIDWQRGDPDADTGYGELVSMSLYLWPGDIANALQMRAAGLLAGLTLSPELMALFLAAERIAGLAQFPIAAAAQAAAPKIAQTAGRSVQDQQLALSQGSLLLVAGAMIGVGTTAVLAFPALLALGPRYADAFPLVLLLTAAHASWGVFGLAQTGLNLIGEHKAYSTIAIISCIISVGLMWAGFVYYGATGGAVAFCLSWWLTNIAYSIMLGIRTGLRSGVAAVNQEMWMRALRHLSQRFRR